MILARAVTLPELNFGDSFAYALAKTSGEPLLFRARISKRPTSSRHYKKVLRRS